MMINFQKPSGLRFDSHENREEVRPKAWEFLDSGSGVDVWILSTNNRSRCRWCVSCQGSLCTIAPLE
jgi:hypothetical protein